MPDRASLMPLKVVCWVCPAAYQRGRSVVGCHFVTRYGNTRKLPLPQRCLLQETLSGRVLSLRLAVTLNDFSHVFRCVDKIIRKTLPGQVLRREILLLVMKSPSMISIFSLQMTRPFLPPADFNYSVTAPLLPGQLLHGKTKHAWQVLAFASQLIGKLLVKSHLGGSVRAGMIKEVHIMLNSSSGQAGLSCHTGCAETQLIHLITS